MLKTRKFPHIGSAHALSAVALFVALGGTAMANDQVRAFVTGADVRNGSLTGRDVRNRSLTATDLAPGVLRAGPQGAAGPQGLQGPRGETGAPGPDLAGATHVRVRGDRKSGENGEALRAALASITDASQTKPYVIQLAPGVYDLGGTTLAMKPHVSIAGAGATVTRITGDQAQDNFGEALVIGADGTLLRDVTVTNRGNMGGNSHYVMVVPGGAAMRIEDAVVEVHTAGYRGFPLIARGGSSVDVRDSRLETDSLETAIAFYVTEGSNVRVRGSELVARSQAGTRALWVQGLRSTAVVETSTLVSREAAVQATALGVATVGASRVVGGAQGSVTCVASYNGNFAPLGANCA